MLIPALIALAAGSTSAVDDDAVHLTLVPKGGMAKIGYYAPQRAEMSETKPDSVKKAPADLAAPMYGVMKIGKGIAFILDEPDGKAPTLYVDSNGNGDFTDDGKTEWTTKETKNEDRVNKMSQGSAMVDIGSEGKPLMVNIAAYRFDKNDSTRPQLKNVLLYYRDYCYEGDIKLGDKSYKSILSDEFAHGKFSADKKDKTEVAGEAPQGDVKILIDANGNGKFDSRGEAFDVTQPFNIGGTTWEITDMVADGSSFKVIKSSKKVEEIPTPPDHSTGKPIMGFDTKDTTGKPVNFPSDYKGKIVLLDFWATWCGPCMKEMPNVVSAYKEYHDKGFEILGISLDNDKSITKMPEVMDKANMTWRQVADGKGWKAEIAEKFAIHSIPATFLVDGTTGKIIGTNLRGEALDKALEKALAGK